MIVWQNGLAALSVLANRKTLTYHPPSLTSRKESITNDITRRHSPKVGDRSLLRLFGGKRIHNRGPSRINSFENEGSIFDGTVHEKPLRHIGLFGSRSMNFRAGFTDLTSFSPALEIAWGPLQNTS